MNTESSKARKAPVRRLSRSSSTKLTSSFRGGSLKNVMEDVEVDDSSLVEVVLTELRPTRRISRGNSAKSLGKKSGSKRRIAPAGMSSLDDSNNNLLPARRLSRGNSASRNGSFRGSLRNVMEDKEADMASLDDNDEENIEVPGERRRSYPPGNRTNSFRSNSLRSMRLYNSTSSLSSCASSSELYKDRNSIDINDFGVEHRYYHETSSEDVSASSASKSIFADSDGFIGWSGNFSSKNIHIELNPTKLDKRNSPTTMIGPTITVPSKDSLKRSDSSSSCTSNLVDSQGFLNWVNNGGSSSRTLSHGSSNDGAAASIKNLDSATLPLAAELKRQPKKLFRQLSSFGGNEEKKEFYEDANYTIAPRAKPTSGSTNILNRLTKSLRSSLSNSSSGELNTMISAGISGRRLRHSTGDVSSQISTIRINREDDVDILELRRELCAAANTKSKRKSFKDVFF